MVAQSMGAALKQSFIVEDIGGGGAIIGSEKVARAAPDGYTLLLHNLQIAANVTLYKTLPFDTVKDFAPVMLVVAGGEGLSFNLSSIIRRSGLESCEAVNSAR